jgi:DNA polymerase-3 subunit beta
MFVKVFRNDIIDGLQKSSGIIPAKTGAAFLRTLWLEAGNGALRIFSTDSSLEFTGDYPARWKRKAWSGCRARTSMNSSGGSLPARSACAWTRPRETAHHPG